MAPTFRCLARWFLRYGPGETLIRLLLALCCSTLLASAQQLPDLSVGGHNVQFHAFGSQGFMYSNVNNYMTMKTTNGSFALTDFGANVSTSSRTNSVSERRLRSECRSAGELAADARLGGCRLQIQGLARLSRRQGEKHAGPLQRFPGRGVSAHMGADAAISLFIDQPGSRSVTMAVTFTAPSA